MRPTLLSLSCFLIFSVGFSQPAIPISGRIVSEGTALKDIDIVNMSTKKVASTDSNGHFTILAKTNDELFIISKNHVDRRIVLTAADFENRNLLIDLSVKPIELEEVSIAQKPLGGYKVSQADLDVVELQKQASTPVVQGVYTGEMANGIDFMRIGKGIVDLFKKKDADKIRPKPTIVFKDYVKDNFQEDFYIRTLSLNREQIFAFIEFCDADPNSYSIAQKNEMAVMDFLIAKSKAFKKLD